MLPHVSGERVCQVLTRAGFVRVGQKGSHVKMRHPTGRIAIVPLHREVALGTMRSILRQAGLTPDEFLRLMD